MDEWYKAAYYDPTGSLYYDYPTGSDAPPTAVASGTAEGTAVYAQPPFASGPADITLAGGLSPYGTMGQGGNVSEWEETAFVLMNDSSSSARGVRGGFWVSDPNVLLSSERTNFNPTDEDILIVGFRVASIELPLLVGDYNGNGVVDAADYTVWRDHFGEVVEPCSNGDGNCNGFVGNLDYPIWKDNFGRTLGSGANALGGGLKDPATRIPEPSSLALAALAFVGLLSRGMYRHRRSS